MKALQRLKARHVDALVQWYSKNQRDFPWRKNPDPYWVWLAEIMSQQTQMATLVPYFHRFIELFPDVQALARAPEESVLSAWAGLGYYSRARNIHRAAKQIVDGLGGKFPCTFEQWLEIPGVGPYTAAAIASQSFGERVPVWDGNVIRVCSRLAARADSYSKPFQSQLQAELREHMSGRDASHFNQALMELGATVCTPRNASCGRCPLFDACEARKADAVASYPPPKTRKSQVELACRVHVTLRPGRDGGYEAFLQPRGQGRWFSGLWDFPSELGGIEKPLEKFTSFPSGAREIGKVRHQITHHKIELIGWVELQGKPRQKTKPAADGRWLALEMLSDETPPVPLSTTAKKVLKLIYQTGAKTDQLAMF